MKQQTLFIAGLMLTGLIAVGAASDLTAPSRIEADSRTIFSDSQLHAKVCQQDPPGENWRKSCTPRDQGVSDPRSSRASAALRIAIRSLVGSGTIAALG